MGVMVEDVTPVQAVPARIRINTHKLRVQYFLSMVNFPRLQTKQEVYQHNDDMLIPFVPKEIPATIAASSFPGQPPLGLARALVETYGDFGSFKASCTRPVNSVLPNFRSLFPSFRLRNVLLRKKC